MEILVDLARIDSKDVDLLSDVLSGRDDVLVPPLVKD